MRKNSISIFVFLLITGLISAQSPYQIDWKKEPYFIGIGTILLGSGLYAQTQVDPLSDESIFALDRANLNAFDRKATFYLKPNASRYSDLLLTGAHLLPLLFLPDQKTRKDFGKIMLLYGETLLLTEGITHLTKRLGKRPRPFVYNELASLASKKTKQARYSFFSGHTSITASNCFFTAKVFQDYYPDSKLRYYVWGTAIVIPALTGYLRVRAGKHYPSDVITGYAVGAAIGFLVPHLHRQPQKNKALSWQVGPGNVRFDWTF